MSARTLIVTRSQPGAARTAKEAMERGYRVVLSPMLAIQPVAFETQDLAGVQGVVVTSGHGVARLAEAAPGLRAPLHCVGETTAAAARAAGFAAVAGPGDAQGLIAQLLTTLNPSHGPLAVVRGRDVAVDAADALSRAGFATRHVVAYAAEPVSTITEEARAALASGEDVGVLAHSARGAAAFLHALETAGDAHLSRVAIAAAISPACAAPLRRAEWRDVVVAATPTREAVFAALDDAAWTGRRRGHAGPDQGRSLGTKGEAQS